MPGWLKVSFIVIGVTAIVLALIIGIPALLVSRWFAEGERRLEEEMKLVEETGEPITPAELEAFYVLPDGAIDATELWTRASYTFDTDEFKDESKVLIEALSADDPIPPPGEEWGQIDAARALLAKYSEETEQLHAASRVGGAARYASNFSEGFFGEGSLTQSLRNAARLLSLEAHVKAHENDAAGVFRCVLTTQRMSECIEPTPQVIDQLIRIAIAGMAQDSLSKLLPFIDPSDGDLSGLMQELSTHDYEPGLYRALVGERVYGLHAFDNPEVFDEELEGENLRQWSQNWMQRDRAYYLQHMRKLIVASHEPWPEKIRASREIGEESERTFKEASRLLQVQHILSAMLLPAQDAICQAFARATATRDCMIVILAIERHRKQHGTLPESLDELVPAYLEEVPMDPFDGKRLRYRTEADHYVVYSVGRDDKDDGGKSESEGGTDSGFSIDLRK